MSTSTNMETQISNQIDKYGNVITLQKQTATYNAYHEATPNWTDSTTASVNAIILYFNPKTMSGEEYNYYQQGLIQEGDLIGWLKATETLEESTDGTTATRYLIVHNNIRYEIIKIFGLELQDNILFKKCVLRQQTL